MKTNNMLPARLLGASFIATAVLFFTIPLKAQEPKPDKKETKSTVTVKVITEKDGKTTQIDTIFVTDTPFDTRGLHEYLSEMDGEMQEMSMNFENMDFDFGMPLPDVGQMDSLRKVTEKFVIISDDDNDSLIKGANHIYIMKEGKRLRPGRSHDLQGQCTFDFAPGCCHGQEWRDLPCLRGEPVDIAGPGLQRRMMRLQQGGKGSLNDLIGRIPMERVKSYSVKQLKDGKRITIDVENGPIFENEDDVIIIRNNQRPVRGMGYGNPHQNVKVIVKHSNAEGENKSPEAPSTPPPPAPAKEPSKK